MRFNANTRYEDVSKLKVASFERNGEAVIFGIHEFDGRTEYFVASFDHQHGCTNASSFLMRNYEKANMLFVEIIDHINEKVEKEVNQFGYKESS